MTTLFDRIKPEYKAIFEHGILTDEGRLGKIDYETIIKMTDLCVVGVSYAHRMFNPGLVGENYARLTVDYSNNETKQEIKVDQCTVEIGYEIYDVSISGLAVLKSDPLNNSDLVLNHIEDLYYNIYNSKNEEMKTFNLDITEDQIEKILTELCC